MNYSKTLPTVLPKQLPFQYNHEVHIHRVLSYRLPQISKRTKDEFSLQVITESIKYGSIFTPSERTFTISVLKAIVGKNM